MRKILLYIAITFTAIGCTKDVDVELPSVDAITITSNIATRVTDSQWVSDDEIGVYMTSSVFGDKGENVLYSTDGSGDFLSTTPLYYPSSGEVNFFAYYPFVNGVSITAYPINSADQIDLLSASKNGVGSSSSAVELAFDHLLSKVSLTIEAGDGLTDSDLAGVEVELSQISTKATFELTTKVPTTTNSSSVLTFATTDDGSSSSAIVIPQLLDGARLCFTTKSHGVLSAILTTKEFETGNQYTYTATLNRDGVELSAANINSWNKKTDSSTADIVDIERKSDGKYYINSAKGLAAFRCLMHGSTNTENATFAGFDESEFASSNSSICGVLTRDVDLGGIDENGDGIEGKEWISMGYFELQYQGTFDGGGYTVSGLYINISGNDQGFFGYVGSGTIKNLGVKGIVMGSNFIGAIVGYNTDGTVINCYSDVEVSGSSHVGGVVGLNNHNATINCCYSKSTVSGTSCVGGIVGTNRNTVVNCYNTGVVSGDSSAGGVVGSGSITANCYWNSETSNVSSGDSTSGTTEGAMTTEEMQDPSFVTLLNNNAYAYNEANPDNPQACAWVAVSGDYPTFDFAVDPSVTYWTMSQFSSTNYPAATTWYISDSEVDDFENLKSALEGAQNGIDGKDITVVFSNLTAMIDHAFYYCSNLTSISLPCVESIGERAFLGCSSLTTISMPSVETISGGMVFRFCTSLTTISMPGIVGVESSTFDYMFSGCTNLMSISLPNAEIIANDMFIDCDKLTNLDFGSTGSGITSIKEWGFSGVLTEDASLTIKIASGVTGVSVSGNTLTYNSGNSTAEFKSITVIADND